MNNDPALYMRGSLMQNSNEMNMYMNSMNNRPVQQMPPFSTNNQNSNNIQSQMNYVGNRFQNLGLNNRNLPNMRNMTDPMVPASSGYLSLANDSNHSIDTNSLIHSSSNSIVNGNITHGNSSMPRSHSPNTVRQSSLLTSTGGPMVSNLITYSNQTVRNPQQRIFSDNNSSLFYSANNLENTKKLQETGCLSSPSWYLYPPAPETAIHQRSGRQHFLERKENSSFFIDPELRQMFLNRIRACLLTSDDSLRPTVPKIVPPYKDITPLENPTQPRSSVSFGSPSLCYKAFSPRDNKVVLLRRFMGVAIPPPDAAYSLQKIKEVQHANLIPVKDMFSSEAFGGVSLIFVFDYHPSSTSLLQAHMSDPLKLNGFASPFNTDRVARPYSSTKSAADLNMLSEPTVWNYFIQLINILRHVHIVLKRSCRVLDPSKVLVQDGQRLRLNCFGVADLLSFNSSNQKSNEDILQQQKEDLISLGKLVLSVTCGSSVAIQENQLSTSLDLIVRLYTPELSTLVRSLVLGETQSVDQLIVATASQCYEHLQVTYSYNDFYERQLMKEMESGRLFRLACKLQTICERNELGAEHDWSETEDRYMLKLFRDFVFHQTDDNGAPWLDLCHIVSCLNKNYCPDNDDDGGTSYISTESSFYNSLLCINCKQLPIKAYQTVCGCRLCDDCVNHILSPSSPNEVLSCPGKLSNPQDCSNITLNPKSAYYIYRDTAFIRDLNYLRFQCAACKSEELNLTDLSSHSTNCPNNSNNNNSVITCSLCFSKITLKEQSQHNEYNCENRLLLLNCRPVGPDESTISDTTQTQKTHLAILAECVTDNVTVVNDLTDKVEAMQMACYHIENRLKRQRKIILSLSDKPADDKSRKSRRNWYPQPDISYYRTSNEVVRSPALFENGQLILPIFNYKSMKQASLPIYSPPFLSKKLGYKLCCKIFLNGDGSGRDTHISVFLVVLPGVCDAALVWPYSTCVTVTLLEQLSSQTKRNDPVALSFYTNDSPNSNAFNRPNSGSSWREIPVGVQRFVSHSQVEERNRNFLVDDLLYISVAVT